MGTQPFIGSQTGLLTFDRFTRPFDWVYDYFILSFTEFRTCFTDFRTLFTEFRTCFY